MTYMGEMLKNIDRFPGGGIAHEISLAKEFALPVLGAIMF
jgi:hypothetical protein